MDETLYDEEDDDLWIEDPYDEAVRHPTSLHTTLFTYCIHS